MGQLGVSSSHKRVKITGNHRRPPSAAARNRATGKACGRDCERRPRGDAGPASPHPRVADKFGRMSGLRGPPRSEGSQPHAGPPAQRPAPGRGAPTPPGGDRRGLRLRASRQVLLGPRTYSDSLAAAPRAPGHPGGACGTRESGRAASSRRALAEARSFAGPRQAQVRPHLRLHPRALAIPSPHRGRKPAAPGAVSLQGRHPKNHRSGRKSQHRLNLDARADL